MPEEFHAGEPLEAGRNMEVADSQYVDRQTVEDLGRFGLNFCLKG